MGAIDKVIYQWFSEYDCHCLSQKEIDKIRVDLDREYLKVFDKALEKANNK